MPSVLADLHVHTALSPCASDDMTPPAILLAAERRGIRVLGVVDHSSAANAQAVLEAAEAFEVRVFVGIEVESVESVHVLALFDCAHTALDMDRALAATMPRATNRPDLFGEQYLVNELGDVIAVEDRMLAVASALGVEDIARMTIERGGIPMPAHVDRRATGLLGVLGLMPPRLEVDLVEVSPNVTPRDARARWPELEGYGLVTSSDAHCLADIGRAHCLVSDELAQLDVPAREWGKLLAQELRAAARDAA